jgi:hypothetical protein
MMPFAKGGDLVVRDGDMRVQHASSLEK